MLGVSRLGVGLVLGVVSKYDQLFTQQLFIQDASF